jgi:catabolite regulation protein CreA
MKEVQHIDLIFQNLLGSSITLGALHDTNVDGLACIFGQLAANRRPQ